MDQAAVRTVEAAPPAYRDARDYAWYDIGGDNVIVDRTVFLPHVATVPLSLVLSWLVRWFVPLPPDARPLGPEEEAAPGPDGRSTPELVPIPPPGRPDPDVPGSRR